MRVRFGLFGFLAILALGAAFAQTDEGDGYGLSLESFTVDTPAVSQYERFAVFAGIRNRRADAFSGGYIGAAIVGDGGGIVKIIGSTNFGAFNPNQRYSKLTVNCVVPGVVGVGRYRLRIVIKPVGGEWRIATQAEGGVPTSLDFEVKVNPNAVVAPLLKTEWSQGAPYNNLFPLLPNHNKASHDNKRLLTDCVTTAFVQIMAFHRHPARGSGQSAEVGPHKIAVPAFDIGTVAYDWDNMLDAYTKADPGTERQQGAVATLMYSFGLARGITGAYPEIVTNFGYDRGIEWHYRAYYDDAAWEAIIKRQLDARLPVYYYGNYPSDVPSTTGYHASVVDGYDKNGRFHVNWGWGGQSDGWYTINGFDAKANPSTYPGESIVINIKPNAGGKGSNDFALMAFGVNKKSIPQSEVFTATVNLRSVGYFSGGQAGLAIVNNSDKIAERVVAVIGTVNYSERRPGSSSAMEMSAFVPEAVTSGQYKVRVVTRPTGGEWKVVDLSAVRSGISNAIPITVTAGEANGGGYGMGVFGLTASKTTVALYEKFDVGYQFKNMGTEAFSGEAGAALVDKNNNIVAILRSWSSGNYVAGSRNSSPISRTCNVPNTVAAGRYRLRMAVRPVGGQGQGQGQWQWRIATIPVDGGVTSIDFTVR